MPETMWIGGTASQKDSKHRQLREAVPGSRVRPPHAVRTTTAAFLPNIFDMGAHSLLNAVLWRHCPLELLRDQSVQMNAGSAAFIDALDACLDLVPPSQEQQTHQECLLIDSENPGHGTTCCQHVHVTCWYLFISIDGSLFLYSACTLLLTNFFHNTRTWAAAACHACVSCTMSAQSSLIALLHNHWSLGIGYRVVMPGQAVSTRCAC